MFRITNCVPIIYYDNLLRIFTQGKMCGYNQYTKSISTYVLIKYAIVILKGILAELFLNIEPKLYSKYFGIYKVVKLLYIRLQKNLIYIAVQFLTVLFKIGYRLLK